MASEENNRRSTRKSTMRERENSLEVFNGNLVVAPDNEVGDTIDPNAKQKFSLMEKIREMFAHADVFASAHTLPVHVTCIIVSTTIIPVAAISIVWDLMAAIVFQIPDLSTIDLPGFLLFISFIAIPFAMYGYMMEYLMHERSRLAVIGLIGVVVHPILFFVRALIEFSFDGFRGEKKTYFEGFTKEGQEAKYPIGIVRYRQGLPYADSDLGRETLEKHFGNMTHKEGVNVYGVQ